MTTNKDLQEKLKTEQEHLFEHSEKLTDAVLETEERRVPAWVRLVVSVARKWF